MHCLIPDPSAVGTQQIAASVTVVATSSGYGSIQLLADAFPGHCSRSGHLARVTYLPRSPSRSRSRRQIRRSCGGRLPAPSLRDAPVFDTLERLRFDARRTRGRSQDGPEKQRNGPTPLNKEPNVLVRILKKQDLPEQRCHADLVVCIDT